MATKNQNYFHFAFDQNQYIEGIPPTIRLVVTDLYTWLE